MTSSFLLRAGIGPKKLRLEKWYDKAAGWVVVCKDENGDQVGDTVVVGTRPEANSIKLDHPAFKSQEQKDKEMEERYGKRRK